MVDYIYQLCIMSIMYYFLLQNSKEGFFMKIDKKTVSFRLPEKDNEKLNIIAHYTKFVLERESDDMLELNASRSTALSYIIREFYNQKLLTDTDFIKYYLDNIVNPVPNVIMQAFQEEANKGNQKSEIFYTKSVKNDNKDLHFALMLDIKESPYSDVIDYGDFRIVELQDSITGVQINSEKIAPNGSFSQKEKEATLKFFNL